MLQSASGYNYTVTAYASFANGGKFDPHGTIGIERYWQGYDSNGNLTGTPTATVNDGMWWPANSGFDKTKGRGYGPYVAGYPGTCTITSPEAGGYGVETLLEVYNDANGPHTIATASIQILPNLPTQNNPPTGNYSNVLNPSGPALNFIPGVSKGSPPVNAYQGNPPRITVQIKNLYPGSTSFLSIYPGDPVSNLTRTGAVTVANSTLTDPVDNGFWSRSYTFDLGTALVTCGMNQSTAGPQTYSVDAIEQCPPLITLALDVDKTKTQYLPSPFPSILTSASTPSSGNSLKGRNLADPSARDISRL